MYTQYDKAIAIAVMSLVSLGVLFFHWAVPGWLTETNIEQILAVAAPIVVGLIPNKATTAQKTEVLASVGLVSDGAAQYSPTTVGNTKPNP